MKKKIFNVFLSILTVVTQINLPVNAVAEEPATSETGDDSGISVSVEQKDETDVENDSEKDAEEANNSNADSSENENTDSGEGVDGEDPFTYEVTYDEEFSKATITISYGREDADYIDLDNADDFQEKADQGVISVNEEKTSELSLAFDVIENGDYEMKVGAYKDGESVANSEKIVNVTDIKAKEADSSEKAEDENISVANESIAEASMSDISGYIKSGLTFAFFIGNKADDELWQRVLAAYSNIQDLYSDSYNTVFYELQGEGNISSLANYASDADDVSAIKSAYEDLTSGSTGHGVICFTYNGEILHVVEEHDDTDEYTVKEQAFIEWHSKYDQNGLYASGTSHEESSSEDGIMTASTGSTYTPSILSVNDVTNSKTSASLVETMQDDGTIKTSLKLAASSSAYTFTAPESGTYYVTLWGADGDSDSGVKTSSFVNYTANDDGQGNAWTAGVGGQGGTVTGYIHLNKGEKIYLSLGFMNGMSGKAQYGGGGIGYGVSTGYRSGGGGLGAIYSSLKGDGQLTNYYDGDSSILMVAGGGGGAEDFYTANWANNTYYCSYNVCSNAYGGNGGVNPTTGYVPSQNNATGATAESGAYKFGLGQNYAAYHNASSGGGGAGYYGGKSANTPAGGSGQYGGGVELETSLRGGTGAGGSSYANTNVVQNVQYIDGDNTTYSSLWPSGQNAGATIEVASLDEYTLTINYYDINTSTSPIASGSDDTTATKVAESKVLTLTTGESYSVASPTADGYSLPNNFAGKVNGRDDDSVIEGTMADHNLTINVYYDYSKVTVNYYEWDSVNGVGTTTKIADSVTKRIQKDKTYTIESPTKDGYVFYYENSSIVEADGVTNNDGHFSDKVTGTKSGVDQTYNVYYVKEFSPKKNIIDINGVAIDQETSDAGVQLKVGDVVTYEIVYENNQYENVTKIITDELPSGLQYVSGSATSDDAHVLNTETNSKLEWNVSVNGATSNSGKSVSDSVTFKANVIDNISSDSDVQNWNRPDLPISYTVTKSANPETGSIVTTNDFITYTITVKNTGSNTINNIVVIDEIPANTEYSSIDNASAVNFNGVSRDGYVKFVIDELVAGGVANLKFTVKVTGEGTATTTENATQIVNVAKYQNYQTKQSKDDDSKDQDIIDKGNKTNETIHYLLGAKIVATKTSNPVSGSTVKTGNTIHYTITTTNDGATRANFVRVTDDIPTGTTYVQGSLKLSGDTGSYVANPVYSYFGYTKSFSTATDSHSVYHAATYKTITSTVSNSYSGTQNGDADGEYYYSGNLASGGSGTLVGTSWSVYMTLSNCSGCSGYYNKGTHAKHSKAYGSTDGNNNWSEIGNLTVDSQGEVKSNTWTGSSNYKYFRFYQDNNCWSAREYKVSATYTYQNTVVDKAAYTETVVDGYHITNANVNVSGGTVNNVVITSSNTNWSYSGIDTSKWNISVSGGTMTLTPKTRGTVGNVSSTDINNALNAIKWTGSTAPNATVTVNGSNVKTGYSDSSNSCKYVTTNGTPYIECIGTDVDKGDQMVVEFDVTVNQNLASTFVIENVGKYSTYQTAGESGKPSTAGSDTTKPTDETNKTEHYLKDKASLISATAEKWSDPTSGENVYKNQTITYYVKVTNTGDMTIPYVQVRDAIPEFTSFTKGCVVNNDGVYVQNGNYVEWVIKDLKVGESATVSFSVKVNPSITSSDTIVNVATYETFTENPGEAGDITNVPTKKTNETTHGIINTRKDEYPETSVHKTSNPVSGSYVHREDEIEYILTVSNSGQNVQDFILVEDKIPDGTAFKELKAYDGGTSSPDLEVRSYYDETEDSVKYIVANLNKNDSVELHFVVTVDKEIQISEITNIAKYLPLTNVGGRNSVEIKNRDLNNENTKNFQTLDNPISGGATPTETEKTKHYLYQPNVTVTKSSDPETNTVVSLGKIITYTLSVTNTGDDVANYVNVADMIPSNTTYVDGSIKTESKTDAKGVKETNGVVSEVQYVLYDLQPGETRTVSFKAKVNMDCQTGAFIKNVAMYDNYEIEHGKPGTDDFTEPSTKTNETIHTVEIDTDIILTGGQGWSNYLPYIGGGLIAVALVIVLIASKKKKEEK